MAKGAGMIAPDMATMLSYVFTDAAISAEALQKLLSRGVKDTFNSITVDSDTSTSDTLDAVRHRRGGTARPEEDQEGRATSGSRISRKSSTRCCSIWRSRWRATARARGNSSKCR